MNRGAEPYIHFLLFQCPSCGDPLSAAIAASEKNPEETDARLFALRCDFGWNGTQMGLMAKRRWLELWD